MASNDWHSSKDLLRAVQSFHEKYARPPLQELTTEAKARYTAIMDEIERQMRELGILVRFEYIGSLYEGTKVAWGGPDYFVLEFEVMLIIDCRGNGLEVEKMPTRADFAKLKIQGQGGGAASPGSNTLFGHFEGNYLDAQKTVDKFWFGQLQKCINNSAELREVVSLRIHGPVTQMDTRGQGLLLSVNQPMKLDIAPLQDTYSVVVVPTYEVSGERYVARPVLGVPMPDNLVWRRSFSIEETEKLLGANENNGCQKKVFRILKVIKNREPNLALLHSYHLKTALFLEMDEVRNNWTEEELGQRVMGVLGQLEKHLDVGNLPNYFLGSAINLFPMSPTYIGNLRDCVRRLRSSEIEMKRILSLSAISGWF